MKYLLALLLACAGPAASACSCLYLSMRQNYQKADFVLRVHVQSLQDTVHYDLCSQPLRPPFQYGTHATVQIQRVYKGRLPKGKLVLTGMESMCDYYFKLNGDYVIFIYKQDVNGQGQYVTSTCQRHFNLADAAARQEFYQARRLEKQNPGGRQ